MEMIRNTFNLKKFNTSEKMWENIKVRHEDGKWSLKADAEMSEKDILDSFALARLCREQDIKEANALPCTS